MGIVQGRNWPYDPEVRSRGPGQGQPPPLHIRRCQGILRDRTQCPFWASRNSDIGDGTGYCKSHGGRRPKSYGKRSMAGMYSKRASARLKELLASASDDAIDRLSLAEEVDVARVMCERAIRLFDGACVGEGADKTDTATKATAVSLVQASLKNVADLVNSYAKLMLVQESVLNAVQVDYLTKMLGEILTRHLHDDHKDVLDAVLHEVEERLRAPDKEQSGIGSKPPVNITIG